MVIISTKMTCNFNNLIFFGMILLIWASIGNSLKCYVRNCETSDDNKYACNHTAFTVESNDTKYLKHVCLTLEYTKSNDSNLKFTRRTIVGLGTFRISERNATEACDLYKNIHLNIAESSNASQKGQVSDVISKCVTCITDLCNI